MAEQRGRYDLAREQLMRLVAGDRESDDAKWHLEWEARRHDRHSQGAWQLVGRAG